MASEEFFFAFNVDREECFSVNMARRLEKLPTPALDCSIGLIQNKKTFCSVVYKDQI